MTEQQVKEMAAKANANKSGSVLDGIIKDNNAYNMTPKTDLVGDLMKQEKARNEPKFLAGIKDPNAVPEGNPDPSLLSSKTNFENAKPDIVEPMNENPSYLTSKTNFENAKIGAMGGDQDTRSSLTNFENQDKTPQGESETVSPIAEAVAQEAAAAPEAVASVTAPEETKTGIGTKIKDLVKKYGVGLADIVEAGAKGYVGDTSETALDKRNEMAYKEKENAFFAKLAGEKAAKDAAMQKELKSADFDYDAQARRENFANQLALLKAEKSGDLSGLAPASIDPNAWKQKLTGQLGGL